MSRTAEPVREPAVRAALAERGFVAVDLGLEGELALMRSCFDELAVAPDQPYFASSVHRPPTVARRVDQFLKELLGPRIRSVLGDVEPFMAAFIAKGARHGEPVEYHQDWTYTDERHERAVLLWIPLVDVGWSNGALSFVPGSHRWTDGVRSDDPSSPAAPFQSELAELAELLPLNAGHGVVYDPAVIHGSSRNVTPDPRPVAAIGFAPRGARLVHFHRDTSGPVRGVEVDESYFTERPFRSRPPDGPAVDAWSPPVAAADLAFHLSAASALSQPDPGHMSHSGPVLRSRRRARRLDRDGFVRFRCLPATDAAIIRQAVLRVLGPHADLAWSSQSSERATWHRAVERVLAQLDAPLADHLRSLGAVRWSLSCLWPGDYGEPAARYSSVAGDAVQRERTYQVWIALDDVTGHNGQLRVGRGSHRPNRVLDEGDGGFETIPLAAGECVVLDPAVVRSSYPNHTDRLRLAVVGTLLPRFRSG